MTPIDQRSQRAWLGTLGRHEVEAADAVLSPPVRRGRGGRSRSPARSDMTTVAGDRGRVARLASSSASSMSGSARSEPPALRDRVRACRGLAARRRPVRADARRRRGRRRRRRPRRRGRRGRRRRGPRRRRRRRAGPVGGVAAAGAAARAAASSCSSRGSPPAQPRAAPRAPRALNDEVVSDRGGLGHAAAQAEVDELEGRAGRGRRRSQFWGFKSRWQTPRACMWLTADSIAREALRRRLVERPRAPAVRRAGRQKGPELAARAEVEDQVDPLLLVEDLVQPADVRVVQLARRRDLGVQPVPARAAPQPDGLARELAAVALPRAAPAAPSAPPSNSSSTTYLSAHGAPDDAAAHCRRRSSAASTARRQFHADVGGAAVEAALGAVPAARVELGQGVDAPEQRLRPVRSQPTPALNGPRVASRAS